MFKIEEQTRFPTDIQFFSFLSPEYQEILRNKVVGVPSVILAKQLPTLHANNESW